MTHPSFLYYRPLLRIWAALSVIKKIEFYQCHTDIANVLSLFLKSIYKYNPICCATLWYLAQEAFVGIDWPVREVPLAQKGTASGSHLVTAFVSQYTGTESSSHSLISFSFFFSLNCLLPSVRLILSLVRAWEQRCPSDKGLFHWYSTLISKLCIAIELWVIYVCVCNWWDHILD